MNTNTSEHQNASITIDTRLHEMGGRMQFIYYSEWSDEHLAQHLVNSGQALPEEPQPVGIQSTAPDPRRFVRISLPPAAMGILVVESEKHSNEKEGWLKN